MAGRARAAPTDPASTQARQPGSDPLFASDPWAAGDPWGDSAAHRPKTPPAAPAQAAAASSRDAPEPWQRDEWATSWQNSEWQEDSKWAEKGEATNENKEDSKWEEGEAWKSQSAELRTEEAQAPDIPPVAPSRLRKPKEGQRLLYKVLADYVPEGDHQVPLKAGDIVAVSWLEEEGEAFWAWGHRLSDPKTVGYLPKENLEDYDEELQQEKPAAGAEAQEPSSPPPPSPQDKQEPSSPPPPPPPQDEQEEEEEEQQSGPEPVTASKAPPIPGTFDFGLPPQQPPQAPKPSPLGAKDDDWGESWGSWKPSSSSRSRVKAPPLPSSSWEAPQLPPEPRVMAPAPQHDTTRQVAPAPQPKVTHPTRQVEPAPQPKVTHPTRQVEPAPQQEVSHPKRQYSIHGQAVRPVPGPVAGTWMYSHLQKDCVIEMELLPEVLSTHLKVQKQALFELLLEPGARQLLLPAGCPPQLLMQRGAPQLVRPGPLTQAEVEELVHALGADKMEEDGVGFKWMVNSSLHSAVLTKNLAGDVSTLAVRLGRVVRLASAICAEALIDRSALILGASRIGKTTVLRDIAVSMADSRHVLLLDIGGECFGLGATLPEYGGKVHRVQVSRTAGLREAASSAIATFAPDVLLMDCNDAGLAMDVAAVCNKACVHFVGTACGRMSDVASAFQQRYWSSAGPKGGMQLTEFPFATVVDLKAPELGCDIFWGAAGAIGKILQNTVYEGETRIRTPNGIHRQMQQFQFNSPAAPVATATAPTYATAPPASTFVPAAPGLALQ